MDHKIYLCLLDCSSIQQYVFGSNKLKSNFGASYIVEEKLYQAWIPETLKEMFPTEDIKKRFDDWRQKPEVFQLKDDPALLWEIGYVGGGNALLLFRVRSDAKMFIMRWTRKLLLYAPGVRPVTAMVECEQEDIAASITGITKAFEELAKNKSSCIAETIIPRHGITAECKITGLSAEALAETGEGVHWVSSVAYTKFYHEKDARIKLRERFEEWLAPHGDQYVFGYDIEKLGQSAGAENHIAIVHIDGNQIGERFKACQNLYEKRQLAKQIEHATGTALNRTLADLLAKLPTLKDGRNKNRLVLSCDIEKKEILPFRPVIGAGDDVTFVCDARLGLFLAESFMLAFAEQPVDLKLTLPVDASEEEKKRLAKTLATFYEPRQSLFPNSPDEEKKRLDEIQKTLSSCAGIAIIKTKYPFYRGYQLAEQLCGSAKKKGRKDNTSWLDFHVSYRGLSGSLSDIRQQKYMVGKASLLWRPWKIVADSSQPFTDLDDFAQLQEAIRYFRRPVKHRGWPRSKIGELAQTLVKGPEETEEFIQFSQARGLILPRLAVSHIRKTGWFIYEENETPKIKTPYFDILEVMKFYPDCLLPEEKKNAL